MAEHVRDGLARIGALGVARKIVRLHNCSERDVFGGRRHRSAAAARHHIWLVLRHTTLMSYPELAAVWGHIDHTSIIHGVHKREADLAREFQ